MIFIIGSFNQVYAVTTILSDQSSCNTLGGVWSEPPPTCMISNTLIINQTDTLRINSGVNLEFTAGNSLINKGSITNNGVISLSGTSSKMSGNLVNTDTATLTNSGTIIITGGGSKYAGSISNNGTATFTNSGTMNLTGSSGDYSGTLVDADSAVFTNSGTINLTGGSGESSGALKVAESGTFTNSNSIILVGDSGRHSGYIGITHSGELINGGTISLTGGIGQSSGLLDNWDGASITNFGTITITGNDGIGSGRITNMGTSSFTNKGVISLTEGNGLSTGTIINSESASFSNFKSIEFISGGGPTIFHLDNQDDGIFINRGTILIGENIRNTASITNFDKITIGDDFNNQGKTMNNCGIITINGILIGNPITESKCSFGSNSHEDPTIGKTSWGLQVVENGICIDAQCWTVTAEYHQDFELVEMLSDSIHTISTTVYCHHGVSKCNYVAFGVSPYGTNINDSIWKVILQKDHKDNWSMTVIDPEGYLEDVTSTTQIVNDGKNLAVSMTGIFKKSTPGMILNIETRDSYGGYRDFQFNDGVSIKDAYAYPVIEALYEKPLEIAPLCLNENPNKRYTCAFDLVRDWVIKNAENKLEEIISK